MQFIASQEAAPVQGAVQGELESSNWRVVAAILGFVVASAVFALSTLERLQRHVIAEALAHRPISPRLIFSWLEPSDALLVLLCVAAAIWLVRLEWPGPAISIFLRSATALQIFLVLTL